MSNFRFPLGLATGEYFCNRVSETQALTHNIASCTHTVLISPRRYGKTSLAYRAIKQSGLPHAKIDLYMCTSKDEIVQSVIKGVNKIIAEISSISEKFLKNLKKVVKLLKPTLEVSTDGLKLNLEMTDKGLPTEQINEALQILDSILIKKKQQCVLLFDEFQEVEVIAKNQGIEGAIRNIAQATKNFTLIFSGSKRTLLKSMFNDRNKPLYRLCDEIALSRIDEKDYLKFVNRFAKKKWHKSLAKEIFAQLVSKTQRHPYYFNALLRSLFILDKAPTLKDVDAAWDDLTMRKRSDVLAETSNLPLTEKKLLVAIANGITKALTGKAFLAKNDLASASVVRGLKALMAEDFIEKVGDHYKIIDPLLQTIIQQLDRI